MVKKDIRIIIVACLIIVGLGISLLIHKLNPPAHGPAIINSSSVSSAPQPNATQSEITQITDPTNFGQYDTAKYKHGTAAYYINLQNGSGTAIAVGRKAVVIYKGWLTNGTLFDETKLNAQGQNQAFEFTYGAKPEQVIRGWDEDLSGMKAGGVRLFIIPPADGYGSVVREGIPPNSVLIFEIQLITIAAH